MVLFQVSLPLDLFYSYPVRFLNLLHTQPPTPPPPPFFFFFKKGRVEALNSINVSVM